METTLRPVDARDGGGLTFARTVAAFLVVGAATISLSACGPKLPSAYGVYLVDGNKVVDITKFGTISPDALGVIGATKILVYDSNVGKADSETLNNIHLERRAKVVREVELLQQPNGDTTGTKKRAITNENITYGKNIEMRFVPVVGHENMIYFVPQEPLAAGGYAFLVPTGLSASSGTSSGHFFGVQLTYPEEKSQDAVCVERDLLTRTPFGPAGLVDIARPKSQSGNTILRTTNKTVPCNS